MWFWNGIFRSVHGNNRCNGKAYVNLEIISLLQKDKFIIWTIQIALLLKSDKIFSKLCEQQTFLNAGGEIWNITESLKGKGLI